MKLNQFISIFLLVSFMTNSCANAQQNNGDIEQDIVIDREINVTVPNWDEPENIKDDRNTLMVYVDAKNQVFIEGSLADTANIPSIIYDFLINPKAQPGLAESPSAALIVLKNDKGTRYGFYLNVYNSIKKVYVDLWEVEAAKMNKPFNELNYAQQKAIKEKYPFNVLETLPQ